LAKTLFNSGKPWTPDDIETLQKLAAEGKPVRLIAKLMGRTSIGVQAKALHEHVLIKSQSAVGGSPHFPNERKKHIPEKQMARSIARAIHIASERTSGSAD
jgi:hypothetical protein